MAKMKPKPNSEDQVLLGSFLQRLRLKTELSPKQLGRIVKVTEQQIVKYEAGAFVPMAMLEKLTEALNYPIQKKYIRQVSNLRHRIIEQQEGHEELIALYMFIFEDIDETDDETLL